MITYFKSATDTLHPFYRSVDFAIDRIREGKSKDIVEKVRSYSEKSDRNTFKKKLPAICFSGKFAKRDSSSIIEHSGFICIDFDSFIDEWAMLDYRDVLIKDKYSYAVFVSPSGDGLKVLVKIPKDPANHKNYFLSLEKYYNVPEFDQQCKDISRVCYESYDPDIYVNKDSEIWTDILTEDHTVFEIKTSRNTIKLENNNEVVRRLLIWWNREFGMVQGQKNNNLFVLASALNEFGIPEGEARDVLLSYDEGGKDKEIINILRSAYKNVAQHATKFYEDTEKIDAIKTMAKKGVPTQELITLNGSISTDVVQSIASDVNSEDPTVFWSKNSKGIVTHINHLYKDYLELEGYYKYYPAGGKNFVFIRVMNNTISDTTDDMIKDHILDMLYGMDDKSIYNYFADKTKLFKEDHLSFLSKIEPKFVRDNIDTAYLYYRNCAVKVTSKGYEKVDYMDIDGYVWEKQKIDRDFDYFDCDDAIFKQFVDRVSGSDDTRMLSIESTIGYLMHSYKPPGYCPAVIINDEVISDNPEGGTGKGMLVNAVSQLKRNVIIDGKGFSFTKSFPYQRVSADTQILTFDDANRNFEFERLFSVITEGITLEKKNKDEIHIPFADSPKIVITTNYAIKGTGNSFERRKWELELAQHYHKDYTPEHEFGQQLFTDWDKNEWLKFDNYMISNLQLYLSRGLIKSKFKNLKERHLIASTSFDFVEWCKDPNNDYTKAYAEYLCQSIYNNFVETNPDYSPRGKYPLLQRKFYAWLDEWGAYRYNVKPKTYRGANGKMIRFDVKLPEQKSMEL